jgi:signal transduction histidine kinase
MRERLRQLGGELHIYSNNDGTRVTASIPVELASDAGTPVSES